MSPSLRASLHAGLLLAIGMGVGRFAFTALVPHMVQEGVIGVGAGSLAASANYAGYLLGAVLAVRVRRHNALAVCAASTAGTVACLAALGWLGQPGAIVAVRALAGVCSALSMVAASVWLMEHRRHPQGAPLLYGGVGIGVAASSELLDLGAVAGLDSHGLWWLMAAASALAGGLALAGMRRQSRAALPASGAVAAPAGTPVHQGRLTAVYGLAGFGYIVTATYLPLLMARALPGTNAAHTWALFGLSAAPSCYLWYRLRLRFGTARALCANLLVQALGVALPLLSASAAAHMLSAALVGGTFLGVVTIAMPAAQRIAAASGRNLVAQLTVVYSLGQIAGPLLAGWLFTRTQGFGAALGCAALALCVAAALSRFGLHDGR